MFVQEDEDGEFMSEPTLNELQQEIVDLKIRVNNLEKRVSKLKQPPPKPKTHHKFI
jgi:hypothetical protein